MEAERPDVEAAAAAYAASLPAELDLLVLGLGEDGRTASLFQGHAANAEERRVVAVTGPADPPRRMTITPPVIRAARATLMLVAGPAKAGAVARALEGPWDPAACPGQWARPGQWLLDDTAAARLDTRAP
jgi:6-phosphogluconolactonase